MKKYSTFIETLKQLYQKKEIDISRVRGMLTKKIITMDEYDYILGKKEV